MTTTSPTEDAVADGVMNSERLNGLDVYARATELAKWDAELAQEIAEVVAKLSPKITTGPAANAMALLNGEALKLDIASEAAAPLRVRLAALRTLREAVSRKSVAFHGAMLRHRLEDITVQVVARAHERQREILAQLLPIMRRDSVHGETDLAARLRGALELLDACGEELAEWEQAMMDVHRTSPRYIADAMSCQKPVYPPNHNMASMMACRLPMADVLAFIKQHSKV